MNKVLLIFAALALHVTPVTAQNVARESPTLPKLSAPLSTLEHGTGWFRNQYKDGQWFENDRIIADFNIENADPSELSFDRSKLDDYTKIEFRSVMFDGTRSLALMRYHVVGEYDDYTLKLGYTPYKALEYCLLPQDFLTQMRDAINETSKSQQVSEECRYSGNINTHYDTEPTLEQEMIEYLYVEKSNNDSVGKSITLLNFDVFPVVYEGEKVVRFNFSYKIRGVPGYPGYDDTDNVFDPGTFNESYYEVDYASFLKLMSP